MKKHEIIKLLEPFSDNDEIMLGEDPHYYIPEVKAICGKGQYGMIYKCCLPVGHSGECYSALKGILFIPDED